MATSILGMDAKLYAGAALENIAGTEEPTGGGTSPWTPGVVGNVKDVTLSMEAGESDVTTRANSGWRGTRATLKEATLEFEMQWKDGDTAFDLIKTAYINSETIALAPLTGLADATGSEGPVGNWSITNFSRNEPLEEAITVSVTAKLTDFAQWLKVA